MQQLIIKKLFLGTRETTTEKALMLTALCAMIVTLLYAGVKLELTENIAFLAVLAILALANGARLGSLLFPKTKYREAAKEKMKKVE